MREKVAPTKASPQSTVYPKPVSPSGAANPAENARQAPQAKEDYDSMKEDLRLKREDEGSRKEIAFLKKAAAFSAKEIGQRLTDLSTDIMKNSASAGCCDG